MSSFQAFDELISSLQGAVIKSQELTQNQHLALMEKYFTPEGDPLMLKIRIPNNVSEDGKNKLDDKNEENKLNKESPNGVDLNSVSGDKYRIIEIPAFCLIPQNSLAMKKVKMDFDVKLVDFGKKDIEGNNDKNNVSNEKNNKNANEKVLMKLIKRNQNKKQIITNIFSNAEEANSIHVEIEFVNKEPPEGIMRINDMMIRMVP